MRNNQILVSINQIPGFLKPQELKESLKYIPSEFELYTPGSHRSVEFFQIIVIISQARPNCLKLIAERAEV